MIILTGSRGFIGSNFLSSIDDEKIVEVEQEDYPAFIGEFQDWKSVSYVLHQGAISSTTASDLASLIDQNVLFSLRLFEKCIDFGIPVKYASSASVYGNPPEDARPQSLYATSKYLIDLWVQDNIQRFRLVQGFRYFNVFGVGERHKVELGQASPVATFAHQALKLGEIRIFEGSNNFFRDFIWVGDLVEIVAGNGEGSGIFDLGSGMPVSFHEVAMAVASKFNVPIREIPMPPEVSKQYQRYTKSEKKWDHTFKTVKEFIEEIDLDQWSL